jgi:ABC-type amino acid transport substrate-binding protein
MVVAKKGSSIQSEADLSGLGAAVVPGSSLEAFIQQKVPDVRLVHVDQTPKVYDAIVEGKADYAPVDSSAALTYLKSQPDLETTFAFPDRFGYGFAVTRGSDIGDALSQHVERLRSSGVYYKMLQRVMGPEAIEVVRAAESEK